MREFIYKGQVFTLPELKEELRRDEERINQETERRIKVVKVRLKVFLVALFIVLPLTVAFAEGVR